ncbi:filamentous hemagglutinin N-terminal domain-containing protein [Candidatus Parabeggiatoa sp. HSG14]|uniref:two-partner secretion domain-containing protein n=1 Tax=Candidatus Parabeggiatoa sp. HSG14 TaxID=3055593 RepID=UPI0025A86546|nr:filamentous hemagglutinin N-terminal domain-containing protein [Thiotrichales bacterium HSG14]
MKYLLNFIFLGLLSAVAYAEVVFDGSLGTAHQLTGPHFVIDANLGQQVGTHLFHSFKAFNLNHPESATFRGPNSIENVISRVTGGQPSYINGLLKSEMPNADMYFINPAGMMFGENARLDIQGSLYISTADYLRLGNNGRFDAINPAKSLLTTAPPSAFGFLDNNIGAIEVNGSLLEIFPRETLAFTGGDIFIRGKTLAFADGKILRGGILTSLGGKIHLTSLASQGEVPIQSMDLLNNTFTKLGKITITDSTQNAMNSVRAFANIDSSGIGGGEIMIKAGQLILDNGYIFADTFGEENGQGVNLQVTDDIILKNAARITTNTYKNNRYWGDASGNAGNINMIANRMSLTEGSQINGGALEYTTGDSGKIHINAKESVLIDGFMIGLNYEGKKNTSNSAISSRTFNDKKGGEINITAHELMMDNVGEIRTETIGSADAGNIFVQVNQLTLKNGAQITANSYKSQTQDTGNGGNLIIHANESVLINGLGAILVNGKAGKQRSGIQSNTFTQGQGGKIILSTPQLRIENNGAIQSGSKGIGNAGNIIITAVHDMVLHQGKITTESEYSAGGDIDIQLNNHLHLIDSEITTKAAGDNKRDSGGNITIGNPLFSILDNSKLTTTGFQGDGGNIRIAAEHFIESSDSILNASSTFGRNGEIFIDSTIEDFTGLEVLPSLFGNKPISLQNCNTYSSKEISTFKHITRHGLLTSPDELQR